MSPLPARLSAHPLTLPRRTALVALGAAVLVVACSTSGTLSLPTPSTTIASSAQREVVAAPSPSPFIPLTTASTAVTIPATTLPLTVPPTMPPTTAAPVAAPPTAAAAPAAPVPAKWLPSGKGMWIYKPALTENGNIAAIVAKAKATGLTHLWVRMGSAWDGFNVAPFVDALLPAAHAAGIKVIGWDFPKLATVDSDIARALTMIRFTATTGDRIDAFSADIETPSEGTHLTAEGTRAYGAALRAAVGDSYPLIATVPRPSNARATYPYGDVTASFDAIAPMVYWLNRQPDTDVAGALRDLAPYGKPMYPVGQAYDGAAEGGRKGVPPPDELYRFMTTALAGGAAGISFWSWQHADPPAWAAIQNAPEFKAPPVVAMTEPVLDPSR